MDFGTARTNLSAHAGRTVQETVHISLRIRGVLTRWDKKFYLRTTCELAQSMMRNLMQ